MAYEPPTINDLGSVQDLTLQNFNKNPGSGDTITIAPNPPVPVPGSGLTS